MTNQANKNQAIIMYEIIDRAYDPDDLRLLCLYLNVDYYNLSGDNKKAKVISLVQYMSKMRRMDELIAQVKSQRPKEDYSVLFDELIDLVKSQRPKEDYSVLLEDSFTTIHLGKDAGKHIAWVVKDHRSSPTPLRMQEIWREYAEDKDITFTFVEPEIILELMSYRRFDLVASSAPETLLSVHKHNPNTPVVLVLNDDITVDGANELEDKGLLLAFQYPEEMLPSRFERILRGVARRIMAWPL